MINPKITVTDIDAVNRVEVVREATGPHMFPPPPKLRTGSSMFDLSTIDGDDTQKFSSPLSAGKGASGGAKKSPSLLSRFRMGDKEQKSKSFWDLSSAAKSPVVDVAPAKTTEELLLATPDPPMDSLTSHSKSTIKKKEKWYRKIITPKSHHVKKLDIQARGATTPTSTLSLNSDIGGVDYGEAKAKKKKKKLLAW